MKKHISLKKIVSYVAALAMMSSLLTAPAKAYDSITFEQISNGQLANYVVSDLTLGDGWTSSNTDVITNEGVVSRSISSDNAVTLTHTSGATFDVTVPAQTTVVHLQSDFYAPDALDNGESTLALLNGDAGIGGFKRAAVANDSSVVTADDDGNHYLKLDYTAGSATAEAAFNATDDVVYISGKFDGEISGSGMDVYFQINLGESSKWVPAMRILTSGQICNKRPDVLGIGTFGSGFSEFCIKVDLKNGKYYLGSSKDNILTRVYDLVTSSPWDSTTYENNKTNYPDIAVTGFKFQRAASAQASGTIYIDDFAVTSVRPVDTSTILTVETMTDEIPEYITKDLTLSSAYDWTTSDPSVITADGKVTRDAAAAKTVTLTASRNGSTKSYDFTVLPTTATPIYQETFYDPEALGSFFVGDEATMAPGEWSKVYASATVVDSEALANGDDNYYLSRPSGTERLLYSLPENLAPGRTVIAYDAYFTDPVVTNATTMYDNLIYFGDYAENISTTNNKGSLVRFAFGLPLKAFPDGYGELNLKNAALKEWWATNLLYRLTDQWVSVKIVVDVTTDTIDVYFNDILVYNDSPLGLNDPTATIKHISFRQASSSNTSPFKLDNLYIGTEVNAFDITSAAYADGKISFSYINNGAEDTSNATVFAVAYDGSDKMVRMSTPKALSTKGTGLTDEITISADGATYFKVFVWDAFSGMNSFTATKNVTVPAA